MENIGREPNIVHGTLHGPGLLRRRAASARLQRCPAAARSPTRSTRSPSTGSRTSITWYVDGVAVPAPDAGRPGRRPLGLRPPVLHDPERRGRRLLARLPGRARTVFPQTMLIDYVRVYSYTRAAAHAAAGRPDRPDHRPRPASVSTSPAPTPPTARRAALRLQRHRRPAAGPSAPTARSGRSASAWTSSGGSTADGARVQLWTCNGTGAQRWTVTGGRRHRQPAGQQVPRRRRQQLRQRHPAADLDVHRRRQPEVDHPVSATSDPGD